MTVSGYAVSAVVGLMKLDDRLSQELYRLIIINATASCLPPSARITAVRCVLFYCTVCSVLLKPNILV
jgi:hypothetical protein